MHPAIFLDRDGVIIENRDDYVRRWEDVEIFPQALVALAGVARSTYKIVVVTNQSVIGRGLISKEESNEINGRLVQEIERAGGRVDGVFVCPHTPDDGCGCRKPRPGLFTMAAQALSLDLSRSLMVGDALSDLVAARAAGIPRLALVRTGRGRHQALLAKEIADLDFDIYDHLQDALEDLIK